MVICKYRSTTSDWFTWHSSFTGSQYVKLNTTDLITSNTAIFASAPTSTVVSLGGAWSGSGQIVAYCWSEVAGFSKFGYYGGNLNADGPFVYTGFRPKFVMIKGIDGGGNWYLFDSARSPYNVVDDYLLANSAGAEGVATFLDFTSNGFKIRNSGSGTNDSGISYLYMAFAEYPFKSALAR
jgi:hypothetical protein